jgi:hypothetical protein
VSLTLLDVHDVRNVVAKDVDSIVLNKLCENLRLMVVFNLELQVLVVEAVPLKLCDL